MNLILFDRDELDRPLPKADARAQHILTVLRRTDGEAFDVGVVNGPRGKASVVTNAATALTLAFTWGPSPPPLDDVQVVIGLPRPQTARDILRDVTTLGVSAIHFVRTAKAEPSYAQSTLWTLHEWRRHVLAGAAQAFDTRLPTITHAHTLTDCPAVVAAGGCRIALDVYEAPIPLSQCAVPPGGGIVLALGPERGWAAEDRQTLRDAGFVFAHLGPRVLRTEAACIAALAVLKAKRGIF